MERKEKKDDSWPELQWRLMESETQSYPPRSEKECMREQRNLHPQDLYLGGRTSSVFTLIAGSWSGYI